MAVLLGAIADDFTGATDLCNTLVRRGMRTVQLIDVPRPATSVPDAEAVVIALKSRTVPAAEAIEKSLAALAWLQGGGRAADPVQILLDLRFDRCRQYRPGGRSADGRARRRLHACSARRSRSGADDLSRLSVRRRRAAVRIGHARPPADADARPDPGAGVAAAEPRPGRAGAAIRRGARRRRHPRRLCRAAAATAFAHAIVDAIEDRDLEAIGEAAADFTLITGGSGIALGLPENFRRRGLLGDERRRRRAAGDCRGRGGGAVGLVLDGDPGASRVHEGARVRVHRSTRSPSPKAATSPSEALAWAKPLLGEQADPDLARQRRPRRSRDRSSVLGRERAGAVVEGILAQIARGLVGCGCAAAGRRRRRDRRRGGAGARLA